MEKETREKEIPQFNADQLKGWEEYRSSVYDQQTKSHDSFEKAMTFITSGALGLTLTFHDKIVPVENADVVFFIALGWFLLVLTLFLNLVSHFLSSESLNKTADEIDKVISYELSFEGFNNNLEKRNLRIKIINKITIWSLGLGLTAVITYVTINIYDGKETQPTTTTETTEQAATSNAQLQSERKPDTTTNVPIK